MWPCAMVRSSMLEFHITIPSTGTWQWNQSVYSEEHRWRTGDLGGDDAKENGWMVEFHAPWSFSPPGLDSIYSGGAFTTTCTGQVRQGRPATPALLLLIHVSQRGARGLPEFRFRTSPLTT